MLDEVHLITTIFWRGFARAVGGWLFGLHLGAGVFLGAVLHGVPDLQTSKEVAQVAQAWADQMAK